jgi:long-chain fatty acid transport protein
VRTALIVAFVLAAACLGNNAWAAGLYLYELGTPDVGLASAGYTTRAGDAGTLFTNPAGMTRLEGNQIMGGIQALYGNASFEANANTSPPLGNNDGGNALGWLPGGSLFFVSQPAPHALPDLRVGLGVLNYFGSALDYGDDWVGRYYLQKGTLIGFSIMPTVAYQVTDWLSVGAGLNAMYGYLKGQVAVNNIAPSLPDGQLEYTDRTWGFGANAGVLLEPMKGTRFGVTYLSQVNLDFKANPQFSNLGPGMTTILGNAGLLNAPLGLGMTLPNRVMFGFYQDLGKNWTVMLDLDWEQWSQFGKVDVSVDSTTPTSLTKTVAYQDTFHFALGAQYRPSERWVLSSGFAFDSSMMDDAQRTVAAPVGPTWRFGLGAQYAVKKNLLLGVAYEFAWTGDLSINQFRGPLAGRVAGTYQDTYANFIALNLDWNF